MEPLFFTSCQAPIVDDVCRAVTRYLGERLERPTEFVAGIPWHERERRLDAGQILVAWICGAPYVWKADRADAPVELLAAPVMIGARYGQRPVYFSDVVVHRASHFETFADLRGARWAYNEPRSHSGYHVVRYHLAQLGAAAGYFGAAVESGAHQVSLQMVLSRHVDATAIDTTVLELICARAPAIRSQLRVIATLGPSPMPPWVIGRAVDPGLREQVRALLLGMHADPLGRAILGHAQIARFAAVTDRDYDPIRRMLRAASDVRLGSADWHESTPGL